jgi:hypothetical protein
MTPSSLPVSHLQYPMVSPVETARVHPEASTTASATASDANHEPDALAVVVHVFGDTPRVREPVDDGESSSAEFRGSRKPGRNASGPPVGDVDANATTGLLDRQDEVRVRVKHAVRRQFRDHE